MGFTKAKTHMKKFFLVSILLLLSFWTIKPLFHQGFFNVHDNVQVERVFEMGQALKDGQFPVRWVQDLGYGYGYPLFNFYAPLPYYVGGFFNFLGVDALTATKIMFGIGILLAGIFMFLLASELWGAWGGMLSALLYIYSPYHALDIYVRGAVNEFWAMVFLPLVFLGMYKIYRGNGIRGVIIGSLGLAGVILSHNLTALMLIPFLILFFLILLIGSSRKIRFLHLTSYFLFLSIALSAFYWLPALFEMKYTNVLSQIGGGADFNKHFIQVSQIWDFPWGFGGSAGLQSGLSFKIGKPNILLWGLSILLFLIYSKTNKDKKGIVFLGAIGLILSVFLTNNLSGQIWNAILPMAFIQYPWRFLEFAAFFSSLLGGFVVPVLSHAVNHHAVKALTMATVILLIFFHSKYFLPQKYLHLNSSYYTNISHLKWEASKISAEYLPKDFPVPTGVKDLPTKKIVTRPKILVKQRVDNTTENSFDTLGNSYSTVSVMTANFPGWKVWVDGHAVELASSPFLTFTISGGKHVVATKFINTPVRSLANLISLLGVTLLGVILLSSSRKRGSIK